MKKNLLFLIGLLCSIIFFVSCREQQTSNQPDISDPNIVTLQQAKTLVSEIGYTAKTKSGEVKSLFTDMENVVAYNDLNGAPNFYVINYKNGNFLILSADKRLNPVLAYSTDGNFDNNIVKRPDGLQFWMDEVGAHIKNIRSRQTKSASVDEQQWSSEYITGVLRNSQGQDELIPFDYKSCPLCPIFSEAKNTFTLKWGQSGPGFDDYSPLLSCGTSQYRAVAGCVPVAAAMAMYYFKYPNTYNWAAMGNGGSDATAQLLRDLGIKMDSEYTCTNGTSTYYANMVTTLEKLGYIVSSQMFNAEKIRSILKFGSLNSETHPIILSAQRSDKPSEGHAWLCTGFLYVPKCSQCGRAEINTLYMNWGWEGHYNGNYNVDMWAPNGIQFGISRKMYNLNVI